MSDESTERITHIDRHGLTFPVTDSGALDGPPVLLLHGWPHDNECWTAVSGQLNDLGFRTFAPTLRGATPTAAPPGRTDYRLSTLIDDAAHIIDALGRGPVHLIGHDLGGTLGWALATGRPDLLRSLTAVASPHPAAVCRTMLGNPRQLLATIHMPFFQLPGLPELLLANPTRTSTILRRAGQSRPLARRDAQRMTDPTLRAGGVNWYRGLAMSNVGWRATTRVPVLEVRGGNDQFFTPAAYRRSQRHALGPYTLATIPDVNHWLPDLAPGQLVRTVHPHLLGEHGEH